MTPSFREITPFSRKSLPISYIFGKLWSRRSSNFMELCWNGIFYPYLYIQNIAQSPGTEQSVFKKFDCCISFGLTLLITYIATSITPQFMYVYIVKIRFFHLNDWYIAIAHYSLKNFAFKNVTVTNQQRAHEHRKKQFLPNQETRLLSESLLPLLFFCELDNVKGIIIPLIQLLGLLR